MSDITQQITGSSKGGKRCVKCVGKANLSRKYDSSDTETESSEPLTKHIQRSHNAYQTWAYATKSAPRKAAPYASTSAAPIVTAAPNPITKAIRSNQGPLATNHQVAAGPGWLQPASGEEDALDRLINGIKAGDEEVEAEVR